jgi:glutamyl-tRNA synthetase
MSASMTQMPDGRFAPSPTGPLHLGNLRTAMVAWLFARSSGGRFLVRMEDLDAAVARPEHERSQLDDLRAIGVDWDGEVVRQSERRALYDTAIGTLVADGRTYPCYCTRREIREAASAPNSAAPNVEGEYPGTCRTLTTAQRAQREQEGRPPALRLRADATSITVTDRLAGTFTAVVDDVVLRRNDGVPAYNLAVVVDDGARGIGEVVRADDLLPSTPRQVHLARLLGLPVPAYAHVPLVLSADGARLAKRHGAVTLEDRAALGETADDVRAVLAASLGLSEPDELVTMDDLVRRFDPQRLPRRPWVFEG